MENIANDLAQITVLARTLQPLRDLKAILPVRDSLTWGVDEHIHRQEYEYLVDTIDIKMNYSYWRGWFKIACKQAVNVRKRSITTEQSATKTLLDLVNGTDHRAVTEGLLVAFKRFRATLPELTLVTASELFIPHLTLLDSIPNLGLELTKVLHGWTGWHIRTWNGVQIPIIEYDGVTTHVRYHDGTTIEQPTLNEAVAVLLEHLRVQNTLLPLS
jgi:hypothetical protein